MSLSLLLAWLPLLVLARMMTMSRVRAMMMRRRGIRAIIVDWQRPLQELLYDTLVIIVFFFWIYLLVAEAWPLSLDWLPSWLTAKLVDVVPIKVAGAILLLAAALLFAAALWSMGASWRIGIDTQEPGPLVTTGLFALMRNPIYVAVDVLFLGTFLYHGRAVFLVLAVALTLVAAAVAGLLACRRARAHWAE